jgi:hypothetical protein
VLCKKNPIPDQVSDFFMRLAWALELPNTLEQALEQPCTSNAVPALRLVHFSSLRLIPN